MPIVALLATCLAHSQARGPAAQEVRQNGQHVDLAQEARIRAWQQAKEQQDQERALLSQDPALRASKLAQVDAFLRRLPGRFRIAGTIQRTMLTGIRGAPGIPDSVAKVQRSGAVTGVADCSPVGSGAGVNCFISASWPIIDNDNGAGLPIGSAAYLRFARPFTGSELLDTMRPAVLVLGVTTDPPGIRAVLVTADTLANDFVGELAGNSAKLNRSVFCLAERCYGNLDITAEPGSDTVSFSLTTLWNPVTVNLTMHRDPAAKLDTPLKPLKAR